MKNHLLFFLILSFASGILAADFFYLPVFYVEISLLLTFLGAFILKKSKFFIFIGFLGFFILGSLGYQTYNKKPSDHYSNFIKNEKNISLKLTISKLEKETSNYCIYKADVLYFFDQKTLKKVKGAILLQLQKGENWHKLIENSEIWAFGNFYEIKENVSSSFSYKNYLAKKKIYHKFFVKKNKWKIQKRSEGVFLKIQMFKTKVLDKLKKIGFSGSELSIFQALFFGEKSYIDSSLREVYAKSGAMHFLAISGFHIGIIFSIFFFLFYGFTFFPFGDKIRILLALSMMWAFVFFVGFSPSATRSALMLSFYSIFNLLKRAALPYHIVSLSAFILLGFNPNYLFDLGFQFSYLAVFFIFYFYDRFKTYARTKNKFINYFTGFLSLSFSAQLGTFPMVIYYFKSFSLFSFFSSLVLTPLFFVLLGFGILLSTLEVFDIFILEGWKLIGKIIFLINQFLSFVSSLQPNVFNKIEISFEMLLFFYVGIILLKPVLCILKKKLTYKT